MSKTAVKQKRGTSLFYTINRILIGITLIASVIGMFFVNDDSQRSRFAFAAVQSLLFLLCSFVPNFLEKKAKVNFSNILLVIYLVVCICHFVLGEIFGFYVNVKGWDSILHTFTGATLAIVSFSMINLLNENVKGLKLSPLFVAIFAVCFAVTIGVLWEVVEYFCRPTHGFKYATLYELCNRGTIYWKKCIKRYNERLNVRYHWCNDLCNDWLFCFKA